MSEWAKKLEPFWNNWTVDEYIGEGSGGKVWRIKHPTPYGNEFAALKEIYIDASNNNLDLALMEGLDKNGMKVYSHSLLEQVLLEISIMKDIGSHRNIVHYYDCLVYEVKGDNVYLIASETGDLSTDPDGWIVFIRMELLIPFTKRMTLHKFGLKDVCKLGIDICNALDMCSDHNIIHGDIKPDNIFWDEKADTYKLGDFGISRYQSVSGLDIVHAGTLTYMSPEVYKGAEITRQADLYSLGMILYRLLNSNRIPFLEPFPTPYTASDRNQALARRLNGEEPPLPYCANHNTSIDTGIGVELTKEDRKKTYSVGIIVQKAIAPIEKCRYETPSELRKQLEAVYSEIL